MVENLGPEDVRKGKLGLLTKTRLEEVSRDTLELTIHLFRKGTLFNLGLDPGPFTYGKWIMGTRFRTRRTSPTENSIWQKNWGKTEATRSN